MTAKDFKIHDDGIEPTAVVSAGNHSLTIDPAHAFVPTFTVRPEFNGFGTISEIGEPTCIYRDE